MKDTIHEDTLMVYHDALSLMTSKTTKEWRRKKGYLKQWILPSEDLFDNLSVEVKSKYKKHPIGNSPEVMPLDAHLNQDVHSSHDFHKTLFDNLSENHPKKFSGNTPYRLAFSYLRLFHPVNGITQSSKRIIKDITRVLDSLEKVRGARGCITMRYMLICLTIGKTKCSNQLHCQILMMKFLTKLKTMILILDPKQ